MTSNCPDESATLAHKLWTRVPRKRASTLLIKDLQVRGTRGEDDWRQLEGWKERKVGLIRNKVGWGNR